MSEMSDPVAALQQADERDSWRAELAGAAPGSARAELVERALRASYESEHPSSEPADAAAERGDPLAIANALGVPAGTDPDLAAGVRALVLQDGLAATEAQTLVEGLRRAQPGWSAAAGHAELVKRLGSVVAAEATIARANARLRSGLPAALDRLARGPYANSPEVVLALDALARRWK